MPNSSKYLLAEQIKRRLDSGDPTSSSQFEYEEVMKAVEQAINSVYKQQFFTETLAGGETIPDGSVLALYEGVGVTAWKGVSKSTLPVPPIKLPRDMGVYSINTTDDPFTSFIPIPMGQTGFALGQAGLSDLLGQIGYERRGKEIVYNKDLTALSTPITSVDMQLVVLDISQFNNYESLPITADMEAQIVEMVYLMLAKEAKKVSINDTTKDNQ